MQKKESQNWTGNLLQEFEETKKIAEKEESAAGSTWTIECTALYTLICC